MNINKQLLQVIKDHIGNECRGDLSVATLDNPSPLPLFSFYLTCGGPESLCLAESESQYLHKFGKCSIYNFPLESEWSAGPSQGAVRPSDLYTHLNHRLCFSEIRSNRSYFNDIKSWSIICQSCSVPSDSAHPRAGEEKILFQEVRNKETGLWAGAG